MIRRWGRTGSVIAAAVATLALLAGCASGTVTPPTSNPIRTVVPTDSQYAKFYNQALTWHSCNSTFTCATVTVPLDWAQPRGATIHLSVIRHSAPAATRLGSLFVNPGGPGGSGVDFVRGSLTYAVDAKLIAHYDIIGFDPRGVGHSTAIKCTANPAQLDEFIYGITPGERGSSAWLAAVQADAKKFASGCKKYTGVLLGHVDSISAARDMDVLRAVVGDTKLNYLGYSYGTYLGAMYAQTYPDRVGRLVLDGAVDPSLDSTTQLVQQAKGFEMALGDWMRWCLKQSNCPFAGSVAAGEGRVTTFLNALEASPMLASDGRKVGADTFATAIIAPLYSKDSWKYLTQMFNDYLAGDIDTALSIADWYNERNSNGSYIGNETEAFDAISCLDSPPSSALTWAVTAQTLAKQAPVLGPYFAYGDVLCSNWPYPPVITPAKLKNTGSSPIVVIGTTGDPATPIEWAQSFASQLTDGRFIEYTGEGHTGYNRGSSCVNNLVDRFFDTDVAPARTARC